jgi:exosome complex RNA-binding protein Rrp42 (RNase PH superfamily)
MVLQADGGVLDIASLAAYVALNSTRIPKVETVPGPGGVHDEFELEADYGAVRRLNATNMPVLITFLKVGTQFIADATAKEQACGACSISVCVNKRGDVLGLSKSDSGAITMNEVYHTIRVSEHRCPMLRIRSCRADLLFVFCALLVVHNNCSVRRAFHRSCSKTPRR